MWSLKAIKSGWTLGSVPPIPGVTYSTLLLWNLHSSQSSLCSLASSGRPSPLPQAFILHPTDPPARISNNEQWVVLLWEVICQAKPKTLTPSGRPSVILGWDSKVNLPGAEHQDGKSGRDKKLGKVTSQWVGNTRGSKVLPKPKGERELPLPKEQQAGRSAGVSTLPSSHPQLPENGILSVRGGFSRTHSPSGSR